MAYTDVKSRFDVKSDVMEEQFKARTVGYKTRDEFLSLAYGSSVGRR